MKKIYFLPLILSLTVISACTSVLSNTPQIRSSELTNTVNLSEQNKKIVVDFYEGIFLKHQVKAYADRYIGDQYIQMYLMVKCLL